jgi:sigma-54 specific flagellar transcriptional regulator A
VLQEKSFERVGSNRVIHCNVRIIAATHRNLEAAIRAGSFREDLFYRLNVFPLQLPPLRERLEDLPMLIEHLAERHADKGGPRLSIAADALQCLARCAWPGNVRELSNLLERLAILFPGQTVAAADLPERYRQYPGHISGQFPDGVAEQPPARLIAEPAAEVLPRGGIDLKDHLSAIEIGLIRKALEEADGTVAEAARLLKMRRTTLVEKLRKYHLSA